MKDLEFIPFDANTADDKLITQFFDILDEWLLEMDPTRSLVSREYRLKEMQEAPARRTYLRYLVFSKEHEENRPVGYINIMFDSEIAPNYEENKEVANFYIFVTKDHRSKGLGTQLFKFVMEKTDELNKSIIQSNTGLESGQKFYEKVDGKVVLNYGENRLYIDEVNWGLMEYWRDEGIKLSKSENVTLDTYDIVPDSLIEEFVSLYTETMNQQPFEEYAGRAKITVESRRSEEENNRKLNSKLITMITKESDGSISGITELLFNPAIPHKMEQYLTGVRVKNRGRGLGKWLKANMILLVRDEYPSVEYISTGNMDANAPMLSINERMGFKLFQSVKFYSFDKTKARKILEQNS